MVLFKSLELGNRAPPWRGEESPNIANPVYGRGMVMASTSDFVRVGAPISQDRRR